jgi:hypothetical protein
MQGRLAVASIQKMLDAQAAQASEGRWPRICERSSAGGAVRARCAHVF